MAQPWIDLRRTPNDPARPRSRSIMCMEAHNCRGGRARNNVAAALSLCGLMEFRDEMAFKLDPQRTDQRSPADPRLGVRAAASPHAVRTTWQDGDRSAPGRHSRRAVPPRRLRTGRGRGTQNAHGPVPARARPLALLYGGQIRTDSRAGQPPRARPGARCRKQHKCSQRHRTARAASRMSMPSFAAEPLSRCPRAASPRSI